MTQPQEPLIENFRATYGHTPTLIARAPGRVNLIGEHTDYNDGFVLPIAIDYDIVVVGAPAREDAPRRMRVKSVNFDSQSAFSIDHIVKSDTEPWSNYIRGVLWVLAGAGYDPAGFDAVVAGDVPLAAGLSSSAAMEVATMEVCDALYGLGLEATEKAVLCQRAENQFVGVNCGIMDQLIAATGIADHAMLIDCRSLKGSPVRMPDEVAVVVFDSKVQRGLVDSAYNERRRQCEDGARRLGVPALRDVTPPMFETHQAKLPELVRKRCEHVVYEDERTLHATQALRAGDMETVGRLFNESHASMRDLFEITVPPIDALVELAQADAACYGSRMTGGGFGGCTVSLVGMEEAEAFGARLAAGYTRVTGRTGQFYICRPASGSDVRSI
ncbi:MAG: galactokinase [Anaerolineae bacterium]|nr:galactokinase [Anaerolineae bacterium]